MGLKRNFLKTIKKMVEVVFIVIQGEGEVINLLVLQAGHDLKQGVVLYCLFIFVKFLGFLIFHTKKNGMPTNL